MGELLVLESMLASLHMLLCQIGGAADSHAPHAVYLLPSFASSLLASATDFTVTWLPDSLQDSSVNAQGGSQPVQPFYVSSYPFDRLVPGASYRASFCARNQLLSQASCSSVDITYSDIATQAATFSTTVCTYHPCLHC